MYIEENMSTPENIKNKAYSAARQLVRNHLAESAGAAYEKLGPTEKMKVDRAVEKKQARIKEIALKLIPQIANHEKKRLSSFTNGSPLVNYGSPEKGEMDESLNEKFAKKIVASDKKKEEKVEKGGKSPNIHMHNSFGEEVAQDSSVYKAIVKKSDKSGINVNILGEVYDRGMNSWNEDTNVTQQQYAFARVNSFINKGKSYFNEDADLITEGDDAETFKKGDTVYLKTKVYSNSPHSGTVIKVTPTHVHLRTLGGTGLYKAPHSSVTKDSKKSHLHVNYGQKNKDVSETVYSGETHGVVVPAHTVVSQKTGQSISIPAQVKNVKKKNVILNRGDNPFDGK